MAQLKPTIEYPICRLSAIHAKELASLNAQLIKDEGHSNLMSLNDLEARMYQWLSSGDYICYAFVNGESPISYCLCREELSHFYIRQLFTERSYRLRGLGRRLIDFIRAEHGNKLPLRLDVLAGNIKAVEFYEKIGFSLYSHTYQQSK